ncbi:MAG TPA: peptidase MA family metallohydrolase [Candidatus Limnocylindrales bacterium]|nr:peptidase MA family metallohydrolase [Candidatus Limnocylindrales bacterium]
MIRRRRAPGERSGWAAWLAVPALGLLMLLSVAVAPVVRAAGPTFGTPTMSGSLGTDLEVTQPVTLDAVPDRVELLLTFPQASGPLVVGVQPPTATGATTLRHRQVAGASHIYPNTAISARWRITTDGHVALGPEVRMVVADERFDWQTVKGDLIRVHWYEGSRAFAERALRIGQDAIEATSSLLGVTEDRPVDFFVYADQQAFYDALGPGTRENVGGQANSDIRTLFALIRPSDIDDPWVSIVVPHELVHLVVDTAARNPYHYLPRWLNEGLAQYLSQGYDADSRRSVGSAARNGDLIPLDGLTGQFPTSADRFGLAYAESLSAVDFLIRAHGQDALVSLIRSYAGGRTDDEAFRAAIDTDVAGLNDAWLADLGAQKPVRHGPQPAPEGPLPSAWASDGGGTTTGGSAAPGGSPGGAPSAAPAAPAGPLGSASSAPVVGVIVVALVLALVALLLVRRARARQAADTPPPVPGP